MKTTIKVFKLRWIENGSENYKFIKAKNYPAAKKEGAKHMNLNQPKIKSYSISKDYFKA